MIAATTAAMTARANSTAVVVIAGAGDVGGAEAGVIAVAVNRAVPAGEIFRHPSMLRRKAASFAAATKIAIAARSAAMTTAVRKAPEVRAPHLSMVPRKRSFSPANRSRSTAKRRQLLRRRLPLSNKSLATIRPSAKKHLRAQRVIFLLLPPAPRAFLGAFRVACRAGCWLRALLKLAQRPRPLRKPLPRKPNPRLLLPHRKASR